ncbi:TetR/AcrR family transcriptional regulator [Aquipuribacter nitratireducens]|uniref:TetR/AcrR family transcriptional regulator n=1 Tax=Aquipuribacter nitratireducens TaxID=650104 RepID=A0ABW0GI15_9MICO
MPRWPGDSRERLVGAAMRLFSEHGYAATTVDDVAAAAGVTQRTFFRHFPDKEEVLFADDEHLLAAVLAAVRAGDPRHPLAHMRRALDDVAAGLEPQEDALRRRARVIEGDVALTGRELAKQARWTAAVAGALGEAGYEPHRADLLAHVGFAVFRYALGAWLADAGGPGLRERLAGAFDDLEGSFSG